MKLWALLALLSVWTSVHASVDVSEVGWVQKPGTVLPLESRFVDESGRTRALASYFTGLPVVLVFAYSSCAQLCPEVLIGVGRVLDNTDLAPGRDYRLVVVSIDPKDQERGVELRRHLAASPDVQRTAHLLTGEASSIAALTAASGFRFRRDDAHDQFAHAAGFLIADARGTISRYFFGVRHAPEDVRDAIESARGGRIGALADQLLLVCDAFDPSLGRYSALVLLGLRLAALAMLIALIFLGWRLIHPQNAMT